MKRFVYILSAVLAFAACAKEEIRHPSEAQAPATASVYEPVITVDQETNQVTFSISAKGVVPVWLFYNSKTEDFTDRYAQNGLQRIFTSAGDYKVRMQIMNAAGVTPDYVEKSFHIDNTLVNFDKYIKFIAGGAEGYRVWRIDNSAEGHMACGESISNAAGWWSAKPDEKADFGVYDNRLGFNTEGAYGFDPGDAGTVYVNVGVTDAPYAEAGHDADYQVAVDAVESVYSFSVEGDALLLNLPAGTPFPYIPNNDFIKDTKFYVQSMNANAMTLVWYTPTGNGGGPIAWQFILTSKAGTQKFTGFNYSADSNLWKPADEEDGISVSYYYAPGWSQIADPEMVHTGSEYAWNFPSATTDRWQAQVFMVPATNISLSADKNYDFSCILNLSCDATVKVKLHRFDENGSDADNAAAVVDADVPLKAGEETVFFLTDLAGVDAGNIRLVLDFGGCPDNTDASISHIVVKDHAIDDGTVLPDEEEPEEPGEPETGAHYDITGATNFWRSMTYTMSFYTAHGASWEGLPDTGFEADDKNYVYRLTMPEATDSQWQRQVAFHTDMSSSAGNFYDFCCTLTSNEDLPGVTIKLVLEGGGDNDNIFYFADRHAITAYEPFVYKMPNMPGIDMDKIALFFDFGGNAPDTEVEIKDICFQLHQEPQGGGESGGLIEGENLWASAEIEMAYWYSGADWSGALQPAETELLPGNGLRVVMPEGIGGSEWMGQNSFHAAGITASVDEVYDFWLTLEADEDMTVTVKLAWEGHDTTNEFFYDNNVKLTAGEPLKYVRASIETDQGKEERNTYDGIVLFVDSGRSPAGSELKLTDIHFQKHIGGAPVEPEQPEEDYTTNDPSIPNDYYDITGAGNLWRSATITNTYWYSAADWSGTLEPIVFKADDFGGIKVIVPEGIGGNEWQGQTIFHTDIPASADAAYDFCVTVKSDEDTDLTFKLAWEGNDNDHAMFYVNNAKVKAGITYTFKMKDLVPDVDYDKMVLFIDLGRSKVGSAISFTNFCIQKQKGAVEYGENLWDVSEMSTWFSPADWSGGLDPQAAYADGKLTLTVPEGVGGAEWQGQVKLTVNVPADPAKLYYFGCKFLADDDVTVTAKLADANNDAEHAFFYDNAVALTAGEALSYKRTEEVPDQAYSAIMLVLDFGRCPAGTEITVSDFVLRESL
jgi:hypothetical protein